MSTSVIPRLGGEIDPGLSSADVATVPELVGDQQVPSAP